MLIFTDLSWTDAKKQYADSWRNLLQSADINPSLLPDWIECAANAAGVVEYLRAFVATDAGEVVGIIPYYRHTRRMMGVTVKALEFAGNIISYHQEIIAQDHHKELLIGFLEHQAVQGWDVLCLGGILNRSATRRSVEEIAKDWGLSLIIYPAESSPYLRITEKWDEFIVKKSKKFRYKIRKREKDLRTFPEFAMRWFEGQDDSAELLHDVLKIEAGSWKVKADMDITGRPMELRYHEQLLPMMGRENLLFANVLYVRQEPAAYNLCYRWNRRLGQIKTSFNDAFQEFSPGALVLEAALRRAFDDGYQEFDFLGDVMQHKMAWSTDSRDHETLFLFSHSIKGRTLGLLKQTAQQVKRIKTRLSRR